MLENNKDRISLSMGVESGALILMFDKQLGYLRLSYDEAGQFAKELYRIAQTMNGLLVPVPPRKIEVKKMSKTIVVQFDELIDHIRLTRHAAIQVANEILRKLVESSSGSGLILPAAANDRRH